MGILGIENRTENWKTVEHFHGLSYDAKVCLVKRLLGTQELEPQDIDIELFWYGFRDYIDQCPADEKPSEERVAGMYNKYFGDLRDKIQEFRAPQFPYKFNDLSAKNYNPIGDYQKELFDNIRHTEVDIVIQCGDRLIVGEAKYESSLDANSGYVLVHQLIRQHVMAKILSDSCKSEKEIVHFVVGDKESLKNTAQVKFMIDQGWLPEGNVLFWDDIERIAKGC